MKILREVYEHRAQIAALGWSDLRARYVGSVLGFFWSILEPALLILVFSLVFPLILKADFVDWVLFFIVGFIPYRYFNRAVTEITESLVAYKEVISKAKLPLEVIPLAKALSCSISFFLECLILFSVVFFFVKPTFYVLLFPIIFIIQLFIIMGMGFGLCCYFPRYRDLTYILSVLFQALFFLTPIVYRIDFIPKEYRGIYLANPIARLFYLWHGILLYPLPAFVEYLPILPEIGLMSLFSLLTLALGYGRFSKLKARVVSEL
jgi:ABC-type polysaccharide/polyol phosphate export permease